MKITEHTRFKWNDVWFTAICQFDNDFAMLYSFRGETYYMARAEDGAWWHVPHSSNKREDLRGPYTFEQAIAIVRLMS